MSIGGKHDELALEMPVEMPLEMSLEGVDGCGVAGAVDWSEVEKLCELMPNTAWHSAEVTIAHSSQSQVIIRIIVDHLVYHVG